MYDTDRTVKDYSIRLYPGTRPDTINYIINEYPFIDYPERTAKINWYKWVLHNHGNAPAGTHCGSFRAILPDGTRATVKLYL